MDCRSIPESRGMLRSYEQDVEWPRLCQAGSKARQGTMNRCFISPRADVPDTHQSLEEAVSFDPFGRDRMFCHTCNSNSALVLFERWREL
jgi:hypothetical protein